MGTQNTLKKIPAVIQAIAVIFMIYLLLSAGSNYTVDKTASFFMLLLLIFSLVLELDFAHPFGQLVNPLSVAVLCYAAFYTLSVFYATTGNFALVVYSRYLSGFAAFFIASVWVRREPARLRIFLYCITLPVAIAGLLSIDAASLHLFTKGLEWLYNAFFSMNILLGKFEEGTRMTSILGSPNVFGGLSAMGTLLSAYLVMTEKEKKGLLLSSGCLGICSVSLLYCFSLGSLVSMTAAVLVYFIFIGKGNRIRLFFVTAVTLLTAFISVLAGFSFMGTTSPLPLLFVIVTTVLLYFLLKQTEKITLAISSIKRKNALIIIFTFFILAGAALTAALTLTKPFTFTEQNPTLRRSFLSDAGPHNLTAFFSTSDNLRVSVLVESQSYDQASTHTSTILFQSSVQVENGTFTVPFTIPEDADICFVNITAPEQTQLNSLIANGKTIKTDYLLLPTFMVNRLQGLTVNQNAAQRFVFYKDGLKIFKRSPLIGHGPGAFESKILEVQDYYYETNSAHNHYIQTLDEVGIIGFVFFIAILGFSVFFLLKKRTDASPSRKLRGTLMAAVILIIVHASLEFTFTYGIYVCFAFLLFGIISAVFVPQKERKQADKLKVVQYPVIVVSAIALLLYTGQFIASNLLASAARSGDIYKLMDTLETCMILDYTNNVSHKGSYIYNYQAGMDEKHTQKTQKYAADVEKHNSFSSLKTLYTHYFNIGEYEKAFEIINRRMALIKYNPSEWNQTIEIYDSMMKQTIGQEKYAMDFMPVIIQYLDEAYKQLLAYNEITPVPVSLTLENQNTISKMEKIRDNSYSYEEMRKLILES